MSSRVLDLAHPASSSVLSSTAQSQAVVWLRSAINDVFLGSGESREGDVGGVLVRKGARDKADLVRTSARATTCSEVVIQPALPVPVIAEPTVCTVRNLVRPESASAGPATASSRTHLVLAGHDGRSRG